MAAWWQETYRSDFSSKSARRTADAPQRPRGLLSAPGLAGPPAAHSRPALPSFLLGEGQTWACLLLRQCPEHLRRPLYKPCTYAPCSQRLFKSPFPLSSEAPSCLLLDLCLLSRPLPGAVEASGAHAPAVKPAVKWARGRFLLCLWVLGPLNPQPENKMVCAGGFTSPELSSFSVCRPQGQNTEQPEDCAQGS